MILTVIDTETTGLEPEKQEIIEIAFISYVITNEGERLVTKRYESKIKPERLHTASPKALEINGYTEEAWADAPSAKEILPVVCEAISKSSLLLGQNFIFDLRFIEKMCQRHGVEMPEPPPYIDTRSMADVLKENKITRSSSMDYLCKHFNIEFEGRAHTALTDCERTMMVWDVLREKVQDYDLWTFDNPYDPY
jgi:DNA polymerase III epsilon subunit-like protein